MARRDYSNDDDFYTQGFEKKGVLSVWIGLNDRRQETDIDTLQDLCGVGYYRVSDQESNSLEYKLVEISRLLADLSYSNSYANDVISTARDKGIEKARRIVVQYDFAYNPAVVMRDIDEDPFFLGVFEYSDK